MTAYAIWAPGVGYLTDELYPTNPKFREHSHDIRRAAIFGDISHLLSRISQGVTDMCGLQIRKLEQQGYQDVGPVS